MSSVIVGLLGYYTATGVASALVAWYIKRRFLLKFVGGSGLKPFIAAYVSSMPLVSPVIVLIGTVDLALETALAGGGRVLRAGTYAVCVSGRQSYSAMAWLLGDRRSDAPRGGAPSPTSPPATSRTAEPIDHNWHLIDTAHVSMHASSLAAHTSIKSVNLDGSACDDTADDEARTQQLVDSFDFIEGNEAQRALSADDVSLLLDSLRADNGAVELVCVRDEAARDGGGAERLVLSPDESVELIAQLASAQRAAEHRAAPHEPMRVSIADLSDAQPPPR